MESQTPLTKKEKREIRQLEKQKFQESRERKRLTKKIATWIIVLLIVGGSGYGLYYLASRPTMPKPGEAFPILGQEHVAVGATHPAYNSNPPTSGWHYSEPATWGVHQDELPDEQLIHNLEHGGIWISYSGIDDSTKSALEKMGKSQSKVVVEPRAKNDSPIVLASWGRLLKMDKFDEQLILNFIKANRNQSPEPFAQ